MERLMVLPTKAFHITGSWNLGTHRKMALHCVRAFWYGV